MKPFYLFFLIFPVLAFSFSETELESLEDSGTKTFSKSLWRRDISFSLIRNLDVEAKYKPFSIKNQEENEKLYFSCDFYRKSSLCDLSSLYYNLNFTVYYSFGLWAEKYLNYSFLKQTELFLSSSFLSALKTGGCFNRKGYSNLAGYMKCGIREILGGWTAPIYQRDNFFSYFNFSMILLPLSQESKDATLKTAFEGAVSALYFIKKQDKWSGAVSSSHSLTYNHYADPFTQQGSYNYNNPFESSQRLNLIFKQRLNKYLPANTTLFISYSLAIDTYKTYWHKLHTESSAAQSTLKDLDKCPSTNKAGGIIACGNRWKRLALGWASSWRLDQRVYIRFAVNWKDLIDVYNPIHEDVNLAKAPSLDLRNWHFNLTASYSF